MKETKPDDKLALANREGLPDALRKLAAAFPRDNWETHSNFGGLVEFWLQRHVMFRRLLDTMREEVEQVMDGNMDAQTYGHHLSRYGGMFFNELHVHHQIEDTQYFPLLIERENTLKRGFEILDADHHALDELLGSFAEKANSVITNISAPDLNTHAGAFHAELSRLNTLVLRHLSDEEELVVPIVLKHGFDH